jgi:hypothetical protein
VKIPSDWLKKAVCSSDANSEYWLSSNKKEADYAKSGCSRCTVKIPCFLNSMQSGEFYGTNAGLSEYDVLLRTWEEVFEVDEDNWGNADSAYGVLLQELK